MSQTILSETQVSARAKWLVLTAAFLGWMFDGLEMGLFPLVGRPALMDLMGPEFASRAGTWMSMITAGFLVGAAFGGIVFGWLGDRIGRVRAMTISVLVYSLFSAGCGFVTHPWQLAGLRLLASLGMGGEWSLGVALVMEVWPSNRRPLLAGLIGAASNVGFLLIAVMGLVLSQMLGWLDGRLISLGFTEKTVHFLLGHSAWRLLLFLGAVPALLGLLIVVFVPESQRWQQAAATRKKNRVTDIFAPGLARLTIQGTILAAIALLGTWGSVQWIPPWADKLAAGTSFQASARAWSQIWSAVGAISGCLMAAVVAQWTSRRWTYFLICILSLLTCQYLFRMDWVYGNVFLLWVFIVGGITAAFYGWLPLYLPELFPTRIRATGQGFAFNAGRLVAAGGTLYGGQLLNRFGEDYGQMCAWISLIYVVGLVAIWLGPETKGRPLPE